MNPSGERGSPLRNAFVQQSPVDRIKPFWDWVHAQAEAGLIKMPLEVHGEFTGDGLHVQWINDPDVKAKAHLHDIHWPAGHCAAMSREAGRPTPMSP